MDSRRRSILLAAPAFAIGLTAMRDALAQAKVPENDPTAQALGYKADATKVDTAKYKTYAKGNDCANCNFYKSSSAAEGTCMALGNRLVSAKGWCSAWVKKA